MWLIILAFDSVNALYLWVYPVPGFPGSGAIQNMEPEPVLAVRYYAVPAVLNSYVVHLVFLGTFVATSLVYSKITFSFLQKLIFVQYIIKHDPRVSPIVKIGLTLV